MSGGGRSLVAAVGLAAATATAVSAHAAVNARLLRRPPARLPAPTPAAVAPPAVSILVPARNEADHIGNCLRALLRSRGVDLEVLVLDDGSTDGTADAARAAVRADGRVKILRGAPPPQGWLGKPFACAQLAEAASRPVLAFVDADVLVEPDGIADAVALLRNAPLDLLCPYPRQLADGAVPRLVQPLLQWSWLSFLPLRAAERRPRPSLVAANGQLAVCTAAAYRRAGGHAATPGAVLDDLELGRTFARAGLRAGVADGTTIASCRMYDDWREVRRGYTKSLWAAFGSPAGALAAVALLAWLYLLPPVAAVAGRGRVRSLGIAGYAGAVAGRVVTARVTGGRAADAPWHPLSIAAACWLIAESWWRRRRGTLTWRGRPLPGRTTPVEAP